MTRPAAIARQRQKPDDGVVAVAKALARLHARRDHAAEIDRIERNQDSAEEGHVNGIKNR